jgi:hypothetical protein
MFDYLNLNILPTLGVKETGKVKLSLCLVNSAPRLKDVCRYRSTILDHGTRWRWLASCPCLFNPGETAAGYPLDTGPEILGVAYILV